MKPNVIVALLVGLVVGFAVGKVVSGPQQGGDSARPGFAVAPSGGGESEAALAIKSSDMPAGTFTGMTDPQKYAVMKLMNDNTCDCGCGKGTLANCIKTDPGCPNSPAKLKQAVELARGGKSAAEIQAAMFGGAAPAAAARPARVDDSATVYKVPVDGSPVHGPASALVTLVEISDYQCPFCSRGNATVQQLQKDYGPKLRVVMKQNPLGFHDRARPAALAALAAEPQGKYWQLHDKMFENQQALDDASLERYAKDVGLNVAKWKEAMKDPKLGEIISRDQALAGSLGATGTPAFFINGRKLSGAQPIDNFKRIIDEELGKAEAMVKSGVRAEEVYGRILEAGVSAPPAAPAPSAPPSAPPPAAVRKIDVPADSPATHSKPAKVTIVVWSDFECPFCSRALPALKQIDETYGKDVKVVFRHQPLPFHNNARLAAEASMAAHEQGKFWQMHDLLFANQQGLGRENLEKYAKELGLDLNKFKAALESGKFKAKIDADMAAGSAVGANGTPTFFVNGRELVGAQPFPQFKAMIDEEIKKADGLLASGTKLEEVYRKLTEMGAAAPTPSAPAAPPAGAVQEIAIGASPVKGPANAPVTIIAFSDFQCPFCSRVVPTLKQIEDTYHGKVKVAFKNQPLAFHNNARPAAAAALAAHEQGKFWEMHDKLFANQQALDRPSLEKYAAELSLDMGKFRQALDTNKFDAQITSDSQEGTRVGANGTPTFFINGRQLVGAQPFEQFKALIDDELQKKGAR